MAKQKLLVLLKERVKVASVSLDATRAKRDKVQGFLQARSEVACVLGVLGANEQCRQGTRQNTFPKKIK